ncbi:MAG: hypothetical protein HC772_14625 [Leptolyngbyaceae cyanobacterium CRU_2_3]|nr:hypothetical protein [Leptolyngbyaceae cyanobacterium CRU_2_3]
MSWRHFIIMALPRSLNHWAVIRLLPKMQRVVMARFKHRSDADGYVMTLRRIFPMVCFWWCLTRSGRRDEVLKLADEA